MWFRRLLLLLPRNRRLRERELEEELRTNLALAEEDARELAGENPAEAAQVARRDFGSLTRAREEARAVWFPGWDGILQDVRVSLRSQRRAPAFTVVAILSLALGIGSAAALFSLVNTVVLKPLAYREPGKLLFVREIVKPLAHVYPTLPVNYLHLLYWRDHAQSFESISALVAGRGMLTAAGEPELVGTAAVSGNFFETLGVTPALGRTIGRADEQPGTGAVVVITDSLWRRRFDGSPSALGRKIVLSENPYTVAGVLPPDFRFPKNDQLGPLTGLGEHTEVFLPNRDYSPDWDGDYDFVVFARLRSGVTEARGAAELNLLEQQIVDAHQPEVSAGLRIQSRPLQEAIASPVRTSLTVLLAAVLLLVLIVCVNLANLLLARGSARAREYSMRIALGATRGRLMVSSLIETSLLSVSGAALGVVAASAAVGAFARLAPIDLPRLDEAQVDLRVVAFAFGLSLLCAILFGLLPALRLSLADPQTGLRGESHGSTAGRAGLRLREWLVGGEVALGALLLVLAGLLVNSLWHVLHVDRGFSSEMTLDLTFLLPQKYRATADRAAFFDRAAAALDALPGVRLAAPASRLPLMGESNVNHVNVDGSQTGSLDPTSRQVVMVNDRFVSDQYFAAIGIPLLHGRGFEPADRNRNVAVVSARLAAKLFPGGEAIGHTVSAGSQVENAQIVGVVGDIHVSKLDQDPTMIIYVPFWKRAYQVADIAVRASVDAESIEPAVRRAIREIDPEIPAPRMRTMRQMVDQSVAQRRFQMEVAAAFGLAALLLAALGIYGVVAYGVSLQRRELGVRMAMGAGASQVRAVVLRRGLRPVFAGMCAGLMAAIAAGRLVRSLLFGVAPTDLWTLGGVAAALSLVAVVACLLPAHAAARIDPARVLRNE